LATWSNDIIGNSLDLIRDLVRSEPGLNLAVLIPLPVSPIFTKRWDIQCVVVIAARLLKTIGVESSRGASLQGINNGLWKLEKAASISADYPSGVLLDASS
jgi:hypothetical protein